MVVSHELQWPEKSYSKFTLSVTHQEYPLQLVLDVLHPRKCSHSLDHLNENAAHSPGGENNTNYKSCISFQCVLKPFTGAA